MRRLLIKTLLLFPLLLGPTALADTHVGYSRTHHILQKGLQDNHPFISYEKDNCGIILYKNSFDVDSVAVYGKYNIFSDSKITSNIKYGVTTGYSKSNHYNGKNYIINMLFVDGKYMLNAVPSLEYSNSKVVYFIEQVGDASSIGLKLKIYE